jgi:hypothetical protein
MNKNKFKAPKFAPKYLFDNVYEYVKEHCWKNGDWFSRSGFDPEKNRLPECQLMAAKVVST